MGMDRLGSLGSVENVESIIQNGQATRSYYTVQGTTFNGSVTRDFLVTQWLRIHHAVQRAWVRSFTGELHPICCEAVKPMATTRARMFGT